ncbi:Kynureninase (L-kynurenine hydrolase) [Emydomyces testavorans]|uniref:Kynureninase n=1 Tax=Emydomyces testavorans TaxID=2070801 RepID=A0AAF0DI84_9EURO|nr:Kynureninase (L-kynurenine hydrolase) [Emydomyces testavorans]
MGDCAQITLPYRDDVRSFKREYAESLDAQDPLREFRGQFIIPSKADLKRKTLAVPEGEHPSPDCIYLCGNSLGLQPKSARTYVDSLLQTWATKAVLGHFTPLEDAPFPPYMDFDDTASKLMAGVVGALPNEVAVMSTLTGNLHLLMASFYRPTKEKYKIILEGKAFPSDHYAVESQIRHHGFDPKDGMVLIEPKDLRDPVLPTEEILKVIDEHASSTALILLPGIQYYSGQYLDIPTITAHAHSKGLIIGWDCAHAAGNVDLKLHDWDVDFAAWCTYKYVNSGPGSMGGLFVHEKHGKVDMDNKEAPYRHRLTGWWGGDKKLRFLMDNHFVPRPGAAGFQLSNPSMLDMSAVMASLEVFNKATMPALRKKSIQLTGYLEHLLRNSPSDVRPDGEPFSIITPSDPHARGAQLSVLLKPGLLDSVFGQLVDSGIILDQRKPDVIRVAPAPLYNTFADVWDFVQVFFDACRKAVQKKDATS